jgi:hypothetical protein
LRLLQSEKKRTGGKFPPPPTFEICQNNTKAFTEKGLYMLATILRSKQATEATFLIIETFAKLRASANYCGFCKLSNWR